MSRLKPEFNVKMIVIGDSGVGKTHLVRCYDNQVNSLLQEPCSVEIDIIRKVLMLPDCKINLILWDTIGSARFQMLNRDLYKGALGALICFDLSEKVQEERIVKWINEVRDHASEGCCVSIIGTKVDKIAYPEYNQASKVLKEFAVRNNLQYFETSALRYETICLCIEETIEEIKVKNLDSLILNPSTSYMSIVSTPETALFMEETPLANDFEGDKIRFEIEKSTMVDRVRLSNQTAISRKHKKKKPCNCA